MLFTTIAPGSKGKIAMQLVTDDQNGETGDASASAPVGTMVGSSTVKCASGHYTNVGGCTGSKGCNANYAFNDAACGNNRAAIQGDCFIGMAAMSQSGPDESYAAYGPDEGGPKITWRSKLLLQKLCRCCAVIFLKP